MQILAQPRHLESVSRKAKTLVGELEKVNELRNKELANGGFITYETEEKVIFSILRFRTFLALLISEEKKK